jgi:hypothetical protein
VHGLAVLTGQGPLLDVPDATRHHLEELTRTFIDESQTRSRRRYPAVTEKRQDTVESWNRRISTR